MNLHRLLKQREADKTLARRAGAPASSVPCEPGRANARPAPGSGSRPVARTGARRADPRGWPAAALNAESTADALKNGKVYFTDDTDAVIASPTSRSWSMRPARRPPASSTCWPAANTASIIMVNVEADALAGPLLARRARGRHRLSLAYGDQPALICEMVDWARACGFEVMAAGKAPSTCRNSILPRPTRSGRTASPQRWWPPATSMRRCSTTSWMAPRAPSRWPPCPTRRACSPRRPACTSRPAAWTTWRVLRRARTAASHHRGQVEVVSSLERDGRPCSVTCWGVYVTLATATTCAAASRNTDWSPTPATTPPCTSPITCWAWSWASAWPASACAANPPARRPAGMATWWPPPSATCPPDRRWTAKAATRCMAG